MEQFVKSCEEESTRRREMKEETGIQDDKKASTGTLKEAGTLGQPEIHKECEGITYQPRTSTPKKNIINPPTAVTMQRHTSPKRASSDGPLPEEGAPAWPTREGLEEEAELCPPEVQPPPEDEGGAEEQGQDEVHSVAGDLLVGDGPAPQPLSPNDENMSSLNEVMSSINWVTDAAIDNTEGIKKLEESQRCQILQQSKSMNEIELMKYQIRCLFQKDYTKNESFKSLEADNELANKGVEAWRIPFSDLKREGKDSISSKIIQTPSGGRFQAKLFLNGVRKHGSPRLSLVVSETSVSSAALKYKCRVQLVNLGCVANSMEEEHYLQREVQRGGIDVAPRKNEAEFLTLVPIKLLEDQSSGFVMNGVLMVILTFQEI